jgi:16S rRNA processing protein RimM
MMDVSDRLIQCAVIGAPFGVRGAMHLYPSSGQSDHLLDLKEFFYQKDGQYLPMKVLASRPHQDHLIVSFEGITSPEMVKTLVHQKLFVYASALPKLPEDQFYWYQLEGLSIHSLQGVDLGVVRELYSNGPQDVMISSLGHHIPFIFESIVQHVDLASRSIVVDFEPIYLEA